MFLVFSVIAPSCSVCNYILKPKDIKCTITTTGQRKDKLRQIISIVLFQKCPTGYLLNRLLFQLRMMRHLFEIGHPLTEGYNKFSSPVENCFKVLTACVYRFFNSDCFWYLASSILSNPE